MIDENLTSRRSPGPPGAARRASGGSGVPGRVARGASYGQPAGGWSSACLRRRHHARAPRVVPERPTSAWIPSPARVLGHDQPAATRDRVLVTTTISRSRECTASAHGGGRAWSRRARRRGQGRAGGRVLDVAARRPAARRRLTQARARALARLALRRSLPRHRGRRRRHRGGRAHRPLGATAFGRRDARAGLSWKTSSSPSRAARCREQGAVAA